MTRIWFVSAPLYGHLDWGGFLKTAQALQAQGHDVTWVSEASIGGAVTAAGIPFAPVRRTGWLWPLPPPPDFSTLRPQDAVMLRYQRALDTWLSESLVADAVEAFVELSGDLGRPDLITSDPFLSAAALASEKLDTPLAVAGWPAMRILDEEMLYPVQTTLAQASRERIERLCRRFGLEGVNFSQGPTPSIISPHLHISYFSEDWYQAEANAMLPQNLFVGGKPTPPSEATPQWLGDIPGEAPLALVTLGSVFTGDLGFFSWAAQAVARLHYVPIVVIGRNPIAPDEKAKLKAALPPSTRLLNWVDFDQILPRTRLIIHHGGMGTTHAAIIHGIPQLVVPHAADQRGQARRAAQAKVGLNLTAHDVKNGLLLEGVRALSNDEQVKANALKLAEEFAALGGPQRAADAIEKLLYER